VNAGDTAKWVTRLEIVKSHKDGFFLAFSLLEEAGTKKCEARRNFLEEENTEQPGFP
jgi:hypothetical protein